MASSLVANKLTLTLVASQRRTFRDQGRAVSLVITLPLPLPLYLLTTKPHQFTAS